MRTEGGGTTARASIIVPARNEAESVSQCLYALISQTSDEIAEILVIDGMSDDGTREIVAEYAARDPRIRLLDNPKKVVTTAVNVGFRAASSDVILRIDAHADYAPDYVEKCLEVLGETGAGNVGGAARPASDGSYVGDAIKAIHESPFGIGAASFRRADAEGPADTVWPGAWRREALEQAGMYCREDLPRSEDIELNSRIREAGWEIYISPKIKAEYHPRRTIPGLLQQNFDNGSGVIHTVRAGLGGVSIRHLVPVGFVVTLATLAIAGAFWPPGLVLLAGVAGLYSIAAIVFAARVALRIRPSTALILPACFLLLHVSYGLGSLWGMLSRPSGPSADSDAA
ncbi:MAG TPA: glycosyltransferase family 2 protein [Armatimonadota bacterium]|nr:glycosyltransferase family 2 protein [Armatimonadota bacterium]